MSTCFYEEKLPCGGRLRVTPNSWEISYFFSYPDTRCNGTFVTVQGESIHSYIAAFQDNWNEYVALKKSLNPEQEFVKAGKQDMCIRIGSFREGVCLRDHHMPITSEKALQDIVACYTYAHQRSQRAQAMLNALQDNPK